MGSLHGTGGAADGAGGRGRGQYPRARVACGVHGWVDGVGEGTPGRPVPFMHVEGGGAKEVDFLTRHAAAYSMVDGRAHSMVDGRAHRQTSPTHGWRDMHMQISNIDASLHRNNRPTLN